MTIGSAAEIKALRYFLANLHILLIRSVTAALNALDRAPNFEKYFTATALIRGNELTEKLNYKTIGITCTKIMST